ncbi:MAG: hypothetical protein SPH78_07815 [Muribaculaceae bacterium]|nr:hypothetical protein [Muribaculaceae bacterium]
MQKYYLMVVDSMSVSELIAEVLKDWYDNALPFYSKKMSAKVPKYRRAVMTSDRNKPIFFEKIEYISPRNNRFVAIPYSTNRSDFKKRGISFMSYSMFFYRGGNKLLQISHDGDNPLEYHITIFCHHCIQRYCERFLKSTVEINEKLYVEILKRNSVLYSSEVITPKGDKALYLVSDDGIFIGEQINKCGLLIKTYISRAEFFEKQESLANSIMKEIINYKRTNHLLDYTGLAG